MRPGTGEGGCTHCVDDEHGRVCDVRCPVHGTKKRGHTSTLLRETNADLVKLLGHYAGSFGDFAIKLAIRCGEALLAQPGAWAVPDVEEFNRLRGRAREVLGDKI